MLPNPIYYSNSSTNSFPQFFPRVADSPDISSSPSLESPSESTFQRAPHSPCNLRSPPPPFDIIIHPNQTLDSLLD